MGLNENIIIKKLTDKLKDVDVRNDYRIETRRLTVTKDSEFFDLGNDYYVLISPAINIDSFAQIRMRSVDNSFMSSSSDYAASESNKNQIFSNYLEIDIFNYDELKQFELEFLVFILKKNK